MKPRSWGFLTLAVVTILAGGYWWFSHAGQSNSVDQGTGNDNAESTQAPIASVKVALIQKGTVADEITAYGTIVPAAGAGQTVTVSYESRVRRILVSEGQQVSRGDPLMEVGPSPETHLQIEQARNEYESAKKALEYMRQRFELKLATNDQLLQTTQAMQQAQGKFENLQRRGSEGPRTIYADAASLISKVAVQEGAIVPSGNPLIEMVAQSRLEARLGIEPALIEHVQQGQEVALTRVNGAASEKISGCIRRISRAADATTQLVEVFVILPSSSKFLLGEYIAGKITVAAADGLVVPRAAVLPEEDHYVLFTVDDDRAKEHTVRVALENDREVEVVAPDLHPGDVAVVLGNYELKDGMRVRVEKSR